MRLLKSTQGCHVGTIVQAPAGTQPGLQGKNVQPDADDDEGGTAAERRRREEARNRRLRKTYNPLRQDPDDADEYPADAVAMGYLPDFEGRRWRERRMRLSRYIQYHDAPAVDEEDLRPATAAQLDLEFAKEIRYRRNLKGGEARGCTGGFRVARPPPPRSQLRPRYGGRAPGGPPPKDPPDSDADDDDDDDDAPGAPALKAQQVQVEGRVRQWFPSNSNRMATPPATPLNTLAQQTVRPPEQPPTAPPQHPQQLSREQEQAIAKQRRAEESAAADKAIQNKQKDPAFVKERMGKLFPVKSKGKATPPMKPEEKPQGPTKKSTRKQEEEARKKRAEDQRQRDQQEQKQRDEQKERDAQKERDKQKQRDEQRKKQAERLKQQEAANEAKRLRDLQAAQKEEEERRKRLTEHATQRMEELGPEAVQDLTARATETQRQLEASKKLNADREESLRRMGELARKQEQERKEKDAEEAEDANRMQAANKAAYELGQARAIYKKQQEEINDLVVRGQSWRNAKTLVASKYIGGLVEDPDKKSQSNKGTTTTPKDPSKSTSTTTTKTPTPKRPAETTEENQGSSKKAKKDQAGTGGKYGDANRPYKKGEEPWNKGKGPQNKAGLLGNRSDDDDDYESPDELALVAGPSRPGLPPAVPTTPPTTTTTTTTPTTAGTTRPRKRRGLKPGSEGAAKIEDMYRKGKAAKPSKSPSAKR